MLSLMTETQAVAAFGLAGGVMLGLAARLGRFCTLGAIEDALYGRDGTRAAMWMLALGVAVAGCHLLIGLGWIVPRDTLYLGIAWQPLGSVLGGLVFGYGMALAGNCGFGALARLGGGDLRSFVVVLVIGLSGFVVLSGPLAPLRAWAFPQAPLTGDALPGLSALVQRVTGLPAALTGIAIGLALIAGAIRAGGLRRKPAAFFWSVVAGLAIVLGWAGTAWVAAHGFAALPVRSHSFSAPVGEAVLFAMTGSARPLSFGVGSVAGVWIGACAGSLIRREFRWEACEDPRELRRQIFGAMLMGGGAVVALGCTVGQGLSAFALLAWSAPVTSAAIVAGAAIGLRQLIAGFQPAE